MARKYTTAILFCALALLPAAAPAAAGGLSLDPARVPVGVFYNGPTVAVSGEVPAGSIAAVLVTGAEKELTLKKKGKVGGVLWMNVGTVSFGHVPVAYKLLFSQAPETAGEESGLGYEALARTALAGDDTKERRQLFSELVKLKEKEKLFAVDEAGVSLSPAGQGAMRASASFSLPPGAPMGSYDVKLFALSKGQARLVSQKSITVERVGLVEMSVKLAHQHGLLYGILAVVIALAAGLLTGFAFGGGKGGH